VGKASAEDVAIVTTSSPLLEDEATMGEVFNISGPRDLLGILSHRILFKRPYTKMLMSFFVHLSMMTRTFYSAGHRMQ